MKSFLVTSSAPLCGTDRQYTAYGEDSEEILDWLYENWFGEECQSLWDSFSFHCEAEWESEWDDLTEEDKSEFYDNSFENFMDHKYEEWCEDCNLSIEEADEDDLKRYTVTGQKVPEIIYDDRDEE